MKNLVIAALAAAQTMNWWSAYCRSGEDVVWCTLAVFYFYLLLTHHLDKYMAKMRRIERTRIKIKRLAEGENYGNHIHTFRSNRAFRQPG